MLAEHQQRPPMGGSRRIVVVTPIFGGAFGVAMDAADALSELGHQVTMLDMRVFAEPYQAARKAATPAAQQRFFDLIGDHILQQTKAAHCDLLFALALAPIRTPLLQQLRMHGITTAMWHVEQHERFSGWRNTAAAYDVFFRIQEAPFDALLARAGVKHQAYLPLAAPASQRGQREANVPPPAYRARVAFFGSPYQNRVETLSQVADLGLGLWGKGWSGVSGPLAGCVRDGKAYLSSEVEAQVYAGADIVLNPHSAESRETTRDFLNPRLFLLAQHGHFQLTDPRSLLRRHFSENEVITYNSPADLREKVAYYLAHPEARAAVALASQRRARREHTYKHRMRAMLEQVAQVEQNRHVDERAMPAAVTAPIGLGPQRPGRR